MKKTLVFAALASVALVGCTKNVEVANNDLNEITFDTPILAPATKADEITGSTFPTTVDFSVFAWYSATELSGSDVNAGSLYMNDVTVTYDPSVDDNTTDGSGAWKPGTVYFWPKNGYLAFDAYSPSTVDATCDATKGIAFSDFVASTSYANQIDLLYSTRVINKQSSVENTNDKYDGVNIPFNHALSVVKVFVKAAHDTDASLIKVKSVKFKNIKNQGDFSEAAWTPEGTDVELVIGEAANATESTAITTTEAQYGNNHIVLPQDFTGTTAVLEIKYYILGQGSSVEPLEQVATLNLASQEAVNPDPSKNHNNKWLMGKRYNYHITFGLNEIYFAPSITDWEDYQVNVPTID